MKNRSEDKEMELFAINCVHGKNYAEDYDNYSEKSKNSDKDWQDFKNEMKGDLKTRHS
ncbi:MAG: hypothetical protein KME28_27475 [Pelatocladus maniniholoensis HA4357-MV3]|jgi:hypothetical protein|uniref:Uncharacterized protein n=1 Tax=Pelatocladus maniniholoensis HA4357-MV3 TaxID=1117104 RepID=A0A9E3HDR3_9NOST|nr:hypothetical protein [Pelatocladus maniniholoensis HA4357-MV3]